MYIKIYYRKMKIEWVLTDFYDYEIDQIAEIVLKRTKKTEYFKTKAAFLSGTIKDVRIIYDILMKWYYSNCHLRESKNVYYDYSNYIEQIIDMDAES